MFEGLMSLWMMPSACAAATTRAMRARMSSRVASGTAAMPPRDAAHCDGLPPSMN